MQAYDDLLRRTREAGVLNSCASLLGWDESTYMPRGGSTHRGDQMGLLARLGHEMVTAPVVGELLSQIEASALVSDPLSDAAVNVREIRRNYDRAVKVPAKLVEELARVSTTAQAVRRDARKASDFSLFRPHLEAIVGLLQQKADAIGYQTTRYDALLDEYEPGATTADITALFTKLQNDLVPLVQQILASGRKAPRHLLEREFPIDRQRLFSEIAAAAVGFDFETGRLDDTTHPFCVGIGPGDTRICTRYNAHHFNEAFFGTLHEVGHGLYEQGLPADHAGTPLGTFCSLGIHESQSRLWENQVGRSRPFWEHFLPRARQQFASLRDVKLDEWMWAINDVQPSFIRVEADEVTYNLHIILRFELEQALIGGALKAADVPGAWNDKVEKMLGLKVEKDAQGCLQDIHWSFGGLGYFPTYTLGNLYAAQFMDAAKNDLGGLDDDFRRGEFGRLKAWLNEKIHRPAMRWRAGELCQRVTGSGLDHAPLMRYLRDKVGPLYGV